MLNWLSTLNPNKLVDKVGAAVDKSFFTAEERAAMFPKLMEMYHPFKRIQRELAYIFCIPYMLLWTLTFVLEFFDIAAKQTQLDMLDGDISKIVLAVGVLFFGGGTLNSIVGKDK